MKLISFLGWTDRFDAELLEDAKAMYNQMLGKVITPQNRDRLMADLAWAKKTLRRPHRITWYLRYRRLAALAGIADTDKTGAIRAQYDKEVADLARRADTTSHQISHASDVVSSRRFITTIEHYMSMLDKLPEIDQIPFLYQLPSQLLAQMKVIEDEWILTRNAKVDPTETDPRYMPSSAMADRHRNYQLNHERDRDGAEKVIDFGDGFVWWNLGVAYCSAEGEAMGHCGNSPAKGTSERILSLRKRTKTAEESFDTPFCTFILDENGYIGEMKGRGNKKPAKRYHPYIIALLKLPMIKGIKGGGHAPEENFAMDDLDRETQEELKEINPNLRSLDEIFHSIGPDKNFWTRLWEMSEAQRMGGEHEVVDIADIPIPENATPEQLQDIEKQKYSYAQVVVENWADIYNLNRDLYDDDLRAAIALLDSDQYSENLEEYYEITEKDALAVLPDLPPEYLNLILQDLGIRPGPSAIPQAASEIQHSKFAAILKRAIIMVAKESIESGAVDKAAILTVIEDVMHTIRFNVEEIGLNWDKTENGPITLQVSLSRFIDIAESTDGDHGDYQYDQAYIRQEGWAGTNSDSTSRYRDEIMRGYGHGRAEDSLKIARGLLPVPMLRDKTSDRRQGDLGFGQSEEEEYDPDGRADPIDDEVDPDAMPKVSFNPRHVAHAFATILDREGHPGYQEKVGAR